MILPIPTPIHGTISWRNSNISAPWRKKHGVKKPGHLPLTRIPFPHKLKQEHIKREHTLRSILIICSADNLTYRETQNCGGPTHPSIVNESNPIDTDTCMHAASLSTPTSFPLSAFAIDLSYVSQAGELGNHTVPYPHGKQEQSGSRIHGKRHGSSRAWAAVDSSFHLLNWY